jgi:hypothetical protein
MGTLLLLLFLLYREICLKLCIKVKFYNTGNIDYILMKLPRQVQKSPGVYKKIITLHVASLAFTAQAILGSQMFILCFLPRNVV